MKKLIVIVSMCAFSFQSQAQSAEVQQLLLNWEKLTQFRKILQNMYEGYKILDKGYTAVKDISQGNFKLHKNFLDALLQVSPVVKKYKRIADIINYQIRMVKESRAAFGRLKEDKQFSTQEIDYLDKVYGNLFNQSLKSLEELFMVLSAGDLRMSDDERLRAIDRIYEGVVEQFSFLKAFNNSTAILSLQRKAEQAEIKMSKVLADIKE